MRAASRALLVGAVRRVKRDRLFSLDPEVGTGALAAVLLHRSLMLLRGTWLALRTGRLVFPVFAGRGVVVRHPRHLRLGRGVTIEDYCRLDCLGRVGIVLGDGVTLRRGVHIEATSVLRALAEGCVLGERVGISEGSFIGAKGLVTVGDDTILGPQCIVIAENHRFDDVQTPIREQGVDRRGIAIGRDCWLGAGVRVVDGVTIGSGSVVGAGSVVTRSVPESSVAFGVPARVTRSRG